jgi:hypothetical protein
MKYIVTMKQNHGKTRSQIYWCWQNIKQRCFNSKAAHFDRYGGRGITVCERWLVFENFVADMGERPPGMTLERIDNDGPYSPDNCRWATRKEQSNNRFCNVRLTHNGETLTISQWSERTGIHHHTLFQRLSKNLSAEEILDPIKKQNLEGLKLGVAARTAMMAARTHCKRGHEYTPENTGTQISKKGTLCRYCKRCRHRNIIR